MITPSMLEDFREWRRLVSPENAPALEEFIAALVRSLYK
jgi:hypothetical protein